MKKENIIDIITDEDGRKIVELQIYDLKGREISIGKMLKII